VLYIVLQSVAVCFSADVSECEMQRHMPSQKFALQCALHTATHYNTLRRTATHCNTLQHTTGHASCGKSDIHTATPYNALQHPAMHRNPIQRTATQHNAPQHHTTHCNTLQCTAAQCVKSDIRATTRPTHCNTLHHSATHGSTICQFRYSRCSTLQNTAIYCNIPQRRVQSQKFVRPRALRHEQDLACRILQVPVYHISNTCTHMLKSEHIYIGVLCSVLQALSLSRQHSTHYDRWWCGVL